MKIIYDHQIFFNQNQGGPSRYFVELIKELINLNNNPTIISPIDQNIHLKEIEEKVKKKFYFQIKKNFISEILNYMISQYYFRVLDYDLYHLTYFNTSFSTKKPKIITVYDLIHEKYMIDFNLSKYPKKKIFNDIDHFICISNNTKKDLIYYYGIEEQKISVTYLANSIKFSRIKKNPFNKPYFLFVGSRKRYKNFKIILDAYSKLPKIKKNFDIVCFGGGNFIEEEIKNMNKLSIDINNIHYRDGSDEELCALYKNSEALIYPSRYEGFGLPLLEAMSLGCPVISSNSSSLPEVYGDAALSFSPFSVDSLIDCINKITTDNDLKQKLISKGYERVKNFSWKKCALETSIIYKKLI